MVSCRAGFVSYITCRLTDQNQAPFPATGKPKLCKSQRNVSQRNAGARTRHDEITTSLLLAALIGCRPCGERKNRTRLLVDACGGP